MLVAMEQFVPTSANATTIASLFNSDCRLRKSGIVHEKRFAQKKLNTALSSLLEAFPDKQLMARYADGVLADYKAIGFTTTCFPKDTDNGKDWSFLAASRAGHTSLETKGGGG